MLQERELEDAKGRLFKEVHGSVSDASVLELTLLEVEVPDADALRDMGLRVGVRFCGFSR